MRGRERSGSQHVSDGEHQLDLDVEVQADTCYGLVSYPKLTRDWREPSLKLKIINTVQDCVNFEG